MTMNKRIIPALLAGILVFSLFTGCGSNKSKKETEKSSDLTPATSTVGEATAASKEKKTFSWATWAISEEALKPTYMSMAQTFMDANPNVTIETVTYPYAQYKDQLIIAAAASNAPDIAHVKAEWLPAFINLNSLQDLNEVMSPELRKDYFEGILNGVTINGKIVAAPWFNNPYALFYNKTLMEKAGITELPKNWKELMDDARKISALGKDENGNKIYGYALPNSKSAPGCGYNFFPHMWTYGGDFCDENGKITIYSPENVKAFEEAKSIYVDEISPNGATFKDLRNLFAQGCIGFYYDLEMAQGPIAEASPKGADFANEYSAMVIPAMDGPNGYAYITEHHLAVFNSCKELDAVGDFIDHMSGKVVLQILFDAGMGKMPARASVTELEIFKNPEKDITKAFVNALPTARSLPGMHEAFMQADEAFVDTLALLTISKDPVDKIVKDLDERVKELYNQK